MCRWMAYTGHSVYIDKLLYEPEHSLVHQSLGARKSEVTVNADGFGIGWYDEHDEPGLYHEVMPAWSDCNLKNLAHHIRSNLFFAHVRSSTGTATNRSNCHPFSYKNWLFMHNGQIGGYDTLRWHLDRLIPEHLYPFRCGATDSELIFLLMIANGLETDIHQAVTTTLKQTEDLMDKHEIVEPLRFASTLSDGKTLTVMRYSSDDQSPTVFSKLFEQHIVVGSEPLELSGDGWILMPEGHIATLVPTQPFNSTPLF
ncbi:class II glutamine amidotransferase [Marinomonas sp. 2405UD68-3]|uniref:class II glutamine amidotransferase n=1 Tax=Marinomonas sp. 2405UD68-3 TaxID=3391835 RepID=UPI0039C8DFAB